MDPVRGYMLLSKTLLTSPHSLIRPSLSEAPMRASNVTSQPKKKGSQIFMSLTCSHLPHPSPLLIFHSYLFISLTGQSSLLHLSFFFFFFFSFLSNTPLHYLTLSHRYLHATIYTIIFPAMSLENP